MTAQETLIDHYGYKDLAELKAYLGEYLCITMIVEAMELYGRQEYNWAVKLSASWRKQDIDDWCVKGDKYFVSRDSILKLLKP